MLVCRAKEGELDRRSQADHSLEYSECGQDADTRHATQKPVECLRRPMLNNSSPEQAIYEPFLGSGTTLIAAQSCGRVCLGVEIDPLFVDLVIRRWQAFTGEKATRASDGILFDALSLETEPVREAL